MSCPLAPSSLTLFDLLDDLAGWSFGDGSFRCELANVPPLAQDDSATVQEDGSVTVTLTATDNEADDLSCLITNQPTQRPPGLVGTGPTLR